MSIRTFLIGSLLLAGCAAPAPRIADPRVAPVEFSSIEEADRLKMTCQPLQRAEGLGWVDECDRLGREAIDAAVARGAIANVYGPAFGDASIYYRGLPVDLKISTQILKREFLLLRSAP